MYQALYRKWRPKTFSDVVGQEHVTETLQRQVAEGRLSHAYLFTGTRGTGKTTCAKILAKAVNCEHPENGNPCNKCSSCLGIESGGFLDVMELDAASNNGVDHVRALRDEAIYSPAQVKKRVYIIDEVHMLSIAAFNALLKILEEPPEHLMFILATTELHKVPATILSRCQRFAFRRILPREIVGRLNYIAEQEGIDLRPDGAELLAHIADGALRDALSLLDQCAAAGGTIDSAAVLDALGIERCAAMGMSLGGLLVMRAAAFEPRITRAVAMDVFYCMFDALEIRLPRPAGAALEALVRHRTSGVLDAAVGRMVARDHDMAWKLQQALAITGTDSPHALLFELERWSFAGLGPLVRQDVLLFAGERDQYVPLRRLGQVARELVNANSVTTRVFTDAEHAAEHCQVGNLPLALGVVRAWLDETEGRLP